MAFEAPNCRAKATPRVVTIRLFKAILATVVGNFGTDEADPPLSNRLFNNCLFRAASASRPRFLLLHLEYMSLPSNRSQPSAGQSGPAIATVHERVGGQRALGPAVHVRP
jgi:hypothetical protein